MVELGDSKLLHAFEKHHMSNKCKEQAHAQHLSGGVQQRLDTMFRRSTQSQPQGKFQVAREPRLRARPSEIASVPLVTTATLLPAPAANMLEGTGTMSGSGAGPSRIAKEVESEVLRLYVDAGLCPGMVLDFPDPVLTHYPLHLHNFIELGFSPQYVHVVIGSRVQSLNTSTAIQKLQQCVTDLLPPTLN